MPFCRSLQAELEAVSKTNDELDSSSGCEMSTSFEHSNDENFDPAGSPQPPMPTVSVYSEDYNDSLTSPLFNKREYSPPYRRVRALRLFDNPLTPKTIIEKSSAAVTPSTPAPRSRLFTGLDKPRAVPAPYAKTDRPLANINPFTPTGKFLLPEHSFHPQFNYTHSLFVVFVITVKHVQLFCLSATCYQSLLVVCVM